MAFDWDSFGMVTLIGAGVGSFIYCAVRWGPLNANLQYDQEVVDVFAWKFGAGIALIAPVIYLLYALGVFK